MTGVLLDTSVLIKWFHHEGEAEVEAARAIRDAHRLGDLDVLILDLAVYELGNVLVRALKWPGGRVADQLDDLLAMCGTPLVFGAVWMREAARLAADHGLSFCDGAWAAAAEGLRVPLISADKKLLRAGLAESATHAVQRLELAPSA